MLETDRRTDMTDCNTVRCMLTRSVGDCVCTYRWRVCRRAARSAVRSRSSRIISRHWVEARAHRTSREDRTRTRTRTWNRRSRKWRLPEQSWNEVAEAGEAEYRAV